MSFLFPFYLLGLAAVSAPIVLHMIRRRSQKRTVFSSLMFLQPTPPRLQRRKRVENLLLLLLRCAALVLLAGAFARPFLAGPVPAEPAGRRIAILLDTSASMQREGLWNRAVDRARRQLDRVEAADRVALYHFDQSFRTLIGFDQWEKLGLRRARALAAEQLATLKPGWGHTELDTALIAALRACEDDQAEHPRADRQRIVLISDLQQGASLEALRADPWPSHLICEIHRVETDTPTNASMSLVIDPEAEFDPNRGPKVRIANSPNARSTHFTLRWEGREKTIKAHVPAGTTHTLRLPPTPAGGGTLRLAGDDHAFDNALHVTNRPPQPLHVLCLGPDPTGPDGMVYFLKKAFTPSAWFDPKVTWSDGQNLKGLDLSAAHLIVARGPLSDAAIEGLRRHVESGRPGLLVVGEPGDTTLGRTLQIETPAPRAAQPAEGYALLGRMDLKHPLLEPFADPQYSDFTKIHFWNYRRVDTEALPSARVLAWFDSGDPAWFEVPMDSGSLMVMTSSWQPSDSQLALSTKFVPLLYGLVERNRSLGPRRLQYRVGESLSPATVAGATRLSGPDQTTVDLEPNKTTDPMVRPGFYRLGPEPDLRFAVNLRPAESQTAPLGMDELEQLGLNLDGPASPDAAASASSDRQSVLRREQEQRQQGWKWLIVATLAVLTVETLVAARTPSARPSEQEASS